jgi:uncharacterized protein YyaL (SSP411 family)
VANRLAQETSAYLLQHQHNPVDWYPWGEEAFARARELDRLVLVSIGYSSCHWCHVMERESFEDAATAALMNKHLVSIKVDREERPDVDQLYMDCVVRLTGQGGWPLNVFCLPDGRPVFGGTYYPPQPAHGRPSFGELVQALARSYAERRDTLEQQAARIHDALGASPQGGPAARPWRGTLGELCRQLMARADARYGGFGEAPKFPTATNLEAILLASALGAAPAGALEHVVFTLRRMACGGIFDQLGGGFHRYSTDARWLVPHFEKMLYDQGQLLRVYAEAYRQTRDGELAWPVAETIGYLERELRAPEGGFFASQDADSEGEEGRFYVWTRAQVAAVLGEEAGAAFCDAYGVTPRGTFEHTGASVLEHALAGERPRFAAQRERLREARALRPAPATDRKQIAAWIGYAIGGMASAGAAFGRPEWVAAAARAADFALAVLRDARGGWLRIFDGRSARVPAFLDDCAALLCALLDLHRAGGADRYLAAALELAEGIRARFFDRAAGKLWFSSGEDSSLVRRPQSDGDGATPAASGLAALGLVRAAALSGRAELREVVDAVLAEAGQLAERVPLALPTLIRAGALREQEPGLALVIGAPDAPAARALAERARQLLGSDEAVLIAAPGALPAELDPLYAQGRAQAAEPTAYLCRGRACSAPARAAEELALPRP